VLQYAFTLIKHNLFAETRQRAGDKHIATFRQSYDTQTSHSGVAEDSSNLGCYPVSTDKYLRRFEESGALNFKVNLILTMNTSMKLRNIPGYLNLLGWHFFDILTTVDIVVTFKT